MFSLSFLKRRLLIFLAVFGPATITAISDNDAAGVATYSLGGANFGYSLLFVLSFVTVLLAVTQEMGARISIVTQRGLGDLIRERYSIKISLLVFTCLLIANIGTIVANFAALKTASSMFHMPALPLMVFVIVLSFLFISKGDYKTNQRIFLIGTVLYFSYVFSAFKARPDWGLAVTSLVSPLNIQFSKEYLLASIALLGTTITPWGQFFVQSFVADKKLSINKLKYVQAETYFGAIVTDFFSFFMIVATAATLYAHKIPLASGEEAALAIAPFAGPLASALFGFGLLTAAIMGIIIISLSTAYAFSEFFGFEGSLDTPFERGRLFYTLFLTQLIVAASVALIPTVSLFQVVLVTQSLNAILLPAIFYFLLRFTNDKELMGAHTNGPLYNYFIVGASLVIIISSFTALLSYLFWA